MLANYTITIDGLSNGNVIAQPFSVEVTKMTYQNQGNNSQLVVYSCCKNKADEHCENDAIAKVISYELPVMTSSKNADLTTTFEVALTEAYGSNWTKD